ncbi:Protein FAM84A [Phytophthora palmivora]|uniref:Protein FAM84A n=1 Tax=Phytophthora palmivora TaxID=4796 RepID=A0A2P4XP47_9STRA|nr:Protein FAM84A [Phytophthora palmivora]
MATRHNGILINAAGEVKEVESKSEWIGIQALQIYNELNESSVRLSQASLNWVTNYLVTVTIVPTVGGPILPYYPMINSLIVSNTNVNFVHTVLMAEAAYWGNCDEVTSLCRYGDGNRPYGGEGHDKQIQERPVYDVVITQSAISRPTI